MRWGLSGKRLRAKNNILAQLDQFEMELNPSGLAASSIPSRVLGFGEISTVLEIGDDKTYAYKRMPLFSSVHEAEKYVVNYDKYCKHLKDSGLTIPEDQTRILTLPGRPVVMYIIQQQLPSDRFAHKLIHTLPEEKSVDIIRQIVEEIRQVWFFNKMHEPDLALALDGQLSNWVWMEDESLVYVDTSTPLFRVNGEEQLDPELFLKSAPSFLRWIIRWLFLSDVMNRYYDQRQVYIDLTANLYKEQRPDLVPLTIKIINQSIGPAIEPLTEKDVEKYYKEDKLIWTLFLAFRRFDRWLTSKVFRKRYEFILPGKIKR